MQKRRQESGKGIRGKAIVGLALVLALTVACEREPVGIEKPAPAQLDNETQRPALAYHEQATELRDASMHSACADVFAMAAQASATERARGARWYEASRCSARAGDYRQSIFHLQAAASQGFAQLEELTGEPLFRPLHSGSRWQLVVDLVDANERLHPRPPTPGTAPDVDHPTTPCALFEGIAQRLSFRS